MPLDLRRFEYKPIKEEPIKPKSEPHPEPVEPGTIPPLLEPGLKLVFVGYNPGIESGKQGHHYAHRSNRFWRFIYESKLVKEPLRAKDDASLLKTYRYGFTDLVSRSTRGITQLSKTETLLGARALEQRLLVVSPAIVCLVGKGIYETIAKTKNWNSQAFQWGLQAHQFAGAKLFVVPSTSGLVSIKASVQLERWLQLKELVDGLTRDCVQSDSSKPD